MKKFNYFSNAKMMAFAAIAGMSTVFGLTSCEQNDEYNAPQSKAEQKAAAGAEVNDSVFINNKVYNYDNLGISSPDQYVADVDFGFKHQNTIQTRAGIPSFALEIMNHAIGIAVGDKASGFITPVLSQILAEDSGADTMEKLQEMDGKINNLTTMLTELTQSAQNAEVASYYNQRMKEFAGLQLNNCSYFAAYMENIKQGKMEDAQATLDAWARTKVNGSDIATATYDYIKFITDFEILNGRMNITDVYDYWVYQTTPWEHMGYEKREQLRLGDIAVCTSGYILARTLHEQNWNHGGKQLYGNLHGAFMKFMDFYSQNYAFPRHEDRLICQIKDAHIVFYKHIEDGDLYNHPLSPEESDYNVKEFMYSTPSRKGEKVVESTLSHSEICAIQNYYITRNVIADRKNRNITDEEKKMKKVASLDEVLKEVGFRTECFDAGKKHVFPLNAGCWDDNQHMWNENYILRFNQVALTSNKIDEDIIKKNWQVGIMWLRHQSYRTASNISGKTVHIWNLLHWHEYTSHDSQYLYFGIDHRYNGMDPDSMQNAVK